MRRYAILSLLTALAVVSMLASGCKKKSEDEVLPSLDGDLYFQIKPYVRAGDVITLTADGLTHPDGKGIGYWWEVSAIETVRDTVKRENEDKEPVKQFTVPSDKTGLFTVQCGAFANGYYSTSVNRSFYIVDPRIGGLITETGIKAEDAHITDPTEREGEGDYYTTEAGGLTWMRNNLASTASGTPLYDCEVMSYPLGRFYTWDEAQTACPEGWRLPTDDEWAALGTEAGALMADAYFDDDKMWEYWPQVKITNSTGLSVIPAGYAVLGDYNQFYGLLEYAAFWTATSDSEDDTMAKRVSDLLSKIDLSTIMFFLGILMAVAVLQEVGVLTMLGGVLDKTFEGNHFLVTGIIGVLSSIVDNVPLVAGCMGMYPVAAVGDMAIDGIFWQLLAYCAGVGGSMLIIGSAAGVVVMGLEKITFGWYMKKITWVAFAGYMAGIVVYWLERTLLF